MDFLHHRWLDAQLTFQVVKSQILTTSRLYVTALLFVCILFVLQWLFALDQLLEVVLGGNSLSFAERIDFLLDGFINIFRFANDFVPMLMIAIAILQALSLTLLLAYRTHIRAVRTQVAPLGLTIAGVGCVACGGSILTPLLNIVAVNLSVTLAQSISRLLLLFGLVLSYIALVRLAYLVAAQLQK